MSRPVRALIYVALVLGGLLFAIPAAWTVTTSLKSDSEIAKDPTRILPLHPTFANYPDAWHALPFATFVANTVFVTVVATLGAVISASLVAYGFARFKFKGRDLLFYILLATMMLPNQVTMIPVFLIWRYLGAVDTFFPLIVPSLLGGGAFNIFLLRQFFLTIPHELDEAMLIDGAGYFRIWWRLLVPLSKPAIATVILFSFTSHWQSFDNPLIYLNSPEHYTVSMGLRQFQDSFGTNVGQLMSATVMNILPVLILFIFTQRNFIKGVAISGLGGR